MFLNVFDGEGVVNLMAYQTGEKLILSDRLRQFLESHIAWDALLMGYLNQAAYIVLEKYSPGDRTWLIRPNTAGVVSGVPESMIQGLEQYRGCGSGDGDIWSE